MNIRLSLLYVTISAHRNSNSQAGISSPSFEYSTCSIGGGGGEIFFFFFFIFIFFIVLFCFVFSVYVILFE